MREFQKPNGNVDVAINRNLIGQTLSCYRGRNEKDVKRKHVFVVLSTVSFGTPFQYH